MPPSMSTLTSTSATSATTRRMLVATGGNLPLSTALHFKPSELDGVGKVVLWGKLCCDRQNAAAGCTDCADCNDAEAKAVAVQGDPTAEQGCAICLSQFAALDEIRVLPCGHAFHRGCCDQWLLGRRCRPTTFTKACPVCRRDASAGTSTSGCTHVPAPPKTIVRGDEADKHAKADANVKANLSACACADANASAIASEPAGENESNGKATV